MGGYAAVVQDWYDVMWFTKAACKHVRHVGSSPSNAKNQILLNSPEKKAVCLT